MEVQHDLISQIRTEGQLQSLVLQLKSCPVCETLNRADADACIVCSWQGKFATEVAVVTASLEKLLVKCPELLHTLVPDRAKLSLLDRLRCALMKRRQKPKLDISA